MRPGVRVEHVMGMPVVLDLRDGGETAAAAGDAVFDWLRRVDAIFSTFAADSEISRLNRGELALEDAHPDVREVLDRCEQLRVETGGYFDAGSLVGVGVDPTGLVKGWSIDRAAGILEDAGLRNYAVNAGGDMRLRGGALPETCWRVGIQHPLERAAVAALVDVNDLAIATSGTYARGVHIVDPHTGRPPEGVLSVTVCGPELGTADAFATAAFAMGSPGPHWTARLPRGYEAMTICADRSVLSTGGFPGRVNAVEPRSCEDAENPAFSGDSQPGPSRLAYEQRNDPEPAPHPRRRRRALDRRRRGDRAAVRGLRGGGGRDGP